MQGLKNWNFRKWLRITGKLFAGVAVIGLLFLWLVPKIFTDDISTIIRNQANQSLTTNFDFSSSELSFFKHFPLLTFSFYESTLDASASFENDTLFYAKEIYFKINVLKLIFSNQVKIKGIVANQANINLMIDQIGNSNYQIYETETETIAKANKQLFLEIDQFEIKNSKLFFNDLSSKVNFSASDFNFEGDGSLLTANVNLNTTIKAQNFEFQYDGTRYFFKKKLNAKVKTRYNTDELSFKFDNNKIQINKLPLNFEGEFTLLSDGYDFDFFADFNNTKIENVLSAFPPKYDLWMQQTKVKGSASAEMALKGRKSKLNNLYPDFSMKLKLENGAIDCTYTSEYIEDIFIEGSFFMPQLNLSMADYDIENFYFKVDEDYLQGTYFEKNNGKEKLVNADIKGVINLKSISNALGIENLVMDGNVDVAITSNGYYNPDKLEFPKTEAYFKIENGLIQSPYYPNPITNLNADVKLHSAASTFRDASLIVENLNFLFENEPFTANASFSNFEDVDYNIVANGTFNLNKFYKLLGASVNNLDGLIIADLSLKGKQSDFSAGNYNLLSHSGSLKFKNINTRVNNYPKDFIIEDGILLFYNNNTSFNNFKTSYGASDLLLNGNFNNLLSYMFYSKEHLAGKVSISSNFFNLNEFVPSFSFKESDQYNPIYVDTNSVEQYGVLKLPKRVNLDTQLNAAHVRYDSINVYNVSSRVLLKDETLILQQANLELIDATATISGNYKAIDKNKAIFDLNLAVDDFDINRAYNELPLFREVVSAAAYTEGVAKLEYQLSGVLDGEMKPIFPSLEGSGTLNIKNATIKGYKLLGTVSKSTQTDAFESPDLKEVIIPTTIKDNILTIERFRMRSKGFRLRTEGETNLDGDLNLKMRVGLPPFGIIGIPIKVTGTSEEPNISLGRKSADLEAISYEDYLEMQRDSVFFKELDSLQRKELKTKFSEELELNQS
ncbi:AsmA-like C-terminal region-containing protein [Arenibacter sp. GZD96]|uniref:AsmA-like C-terminal region-containing protein n=1 Tax=Aurantibrevibacter litoralis TaxID=3106030 RepID=UPI002AFE3313|nr:AsmA-like C-terminal region-containing protein [Arenibacter sp. GZD-96]MEA1787518.1 AsmA-like C-terminal region-containing protein [Arenibacter sp. GZD-96]